MKPSNRAIDFDVAHALVNYVCRNDSEGVTKFSDSLTNKDVRDKLCEIRRQDGTVCTLTFNQFLSDHQNTKTSYPVDKPNWLRSLVKKASYTYGPGLEHTLNKKRKELEVIEAQIKARRHYTGQGRLRDM